MKEKFNYIGWSLVVIGTLIIIISYVCMPEGPEMCSDWLSPRSSIITILTSSFLTFGVGLALMMIGFAKLYADRWNDNREREETIKEILKNKNFKKFFQNINKIEEEYGNKKSSRTKRNNKR